MPRPRPAKNAARTAVEVATHKMSGDKIRCARCQYIGPADVVVIRSKRKEPRGMERCPECKSLNIICLEEDEFMKNEEVSWECDEWRGCYPSDWRNKLVPGAMAHPAKFSSRLIRKIYEHLFEENWVEQGDSILDPFGGIALGALNAMEMGLRWTGVELEPKFVELGEHNISNWDAKFHSMPHWSGQAVLMQGNSRELLKVVMGQQDSAVSSPPYADSVDQHREANDSNARIERMRQAGIDVTKKSNIGGPGGVVSTDQNYGDTDGQLGAMKGDGFDSAVSSPPFRQSEGGTPEPKPGGAIDKKLYARHAAGNSSAEGYGATEGQLANMKEGDFDGTVSSPPYTGSVQPESNSKSIDLEKQYKSYRKSGGGQSFEAFRKTQELHSQGYGNTDGQLGAESADDFWMAARTIVEQVYAALKPGGHACWVCKDFVRGGERVQFSDQWRQLCEAVGFTTLHEHHALLVVDKGQSMTLDGESVQHSTSYKSFFRRLAENKGSPRIDWETVYCMEKPHE